MESLIVKMNDLYQKEKQDKSDKENSPNVKDFKKLIEKVYIIEKTNIKGLEIKKKINNSFNFPTFQNEKEILTYIEKENIPIKYLNKIIKEIFKYKNKDIIIKFIQKYKDKLTEKNLVLIFKKLNDFDKKNVNEIIEKDEYDKFEKNIDEIYGKEINKMENKKDLCEEEFNKDFNMEFINSMKIINSNPNKAYYIQENITI